MRNQAVLVFTFVLSIGLMQFYWAVREHFSPIEQYRSQIQHVREDLKHQQFLNELQAAQFEEFKQDVATILPRVKDLDPNREADYRVRTLASVSSREQNESIKELLGRASFERGKSLFREGEYARASKVFAQFIDKYGFMSQSIEAYFLIAESKFQLGDMEACTRTVEKMVELFPENELTGFALVRLGQVFERQQRVEEAVDIYRTVLRSFPYRTVASQAQKSLRNMEP